MLTEDRVRLWYVHRRRYVGARPPSAHRCWPDALVADAAEIDAVLADMDAAWLVQLTASTRRDRYRPRPREKQQNLEILQISVKLSLQISAI